VSDQPYGRPTTLPGLGSVPSRMEDVPKWLGGVKETLEVWTGARGSKFDSVVTWRDLASMGIITGDFRGARFSTGRPTGEIGAGGVLIQNGNGTYVQVSIEAFAEKIRNTGLYRDLNKRLNDPTRFDALPAAIRDILLKDIAAEARERGADIRRIETKIQEAGRSMAVLREEVTAAVDTAVAGVRTTAFAYAAPGRAAAGIATQVKARLDDVDGEGVTIEELMYGTAGYDGVMGQYTVKIDANGALAGFGLTATNYDGTPDSAFIIRADRFAIVSPTYAGGMTLSPSSSLIPFGVDASGVYINGSVRINSTSTTLDSLANDIGVNIASTSEFFKVDTAGAAVNSTITLTATLQGGLTGTVTWTASAGWTGTPPTGTNTWTVNAADQSADAVTYTATKVDGADTYTDSFTIVRLRDGSDALTAILTNESHGIPAAANGTSPVFTGAGGTMKVYRGTTLLTSGVTFAIASGGNPDGVTASINSSTGVYSATAAGTWAAGSAVTTITFEATVTASSTVLPKVFTLTKNLQGAAGASSPAVRAQPTSLVFRVAKDGSVSPASISIDAFRQNTSDTVSWATSPAITGLNGTTGLTKTIYPSTTTPHMGSNNAVAITITCGALSDYLTIVKVYEGSDAVTAILSNEAHTIPADAAGGSLNLTGASTTMSVLIGATDDSTNWTYATSASSGVTISGTNTRNVAITALTVDVGTVTITASKSGYASIAKIFTVTKSRQGITGDAGLRGSLTMYKTVSGVAAWSDTTATNRILEILGLTQNGDTTKLRLGDEITQANPTWSTPWATTKYWSGSAWVDPGVVINGNLLVRGTVAADTINATSFTFGSGYNTTFKFGNDSLGAFRMERAWGAARPSVAAMYLSDNTSDSWTHAGGSESYQQLVCYGKFENASFVNWGTQNSSTNQVIINGQGRTGLTATGAYTAAAGEFTNSQSGATSFGVKSIGYIMSGHFTVTNGGTNGRTIKVDGNNEVGIDIAATYTIAGLRVYNAATGFGIEASGNTTKAPLRLVSLASLPTDRTLGSICVYSGNLHFANGIHWYRIDGLVQVT